MRSVPLHPIADKSGVTAMGSGIVGSRVPPGSYDVFVTCSSGGGNGFGSATLTVLPSGNPVPPPPPIATIIITPFRVFPGSQVEVRVPVCDAGTVVVSAAFTGPVVLQSAADGGIFGTATIDRRATPGAFQVFVACESASAVGTVVVVGSGRPPVRVPSGGVSTGFGGMAHHPAPFAAERRLTPSNLPIDPQMLDHAPASAQHTNALSIRRQSSMAILTSRTPIALTAPALRLLGALTVILGLVLGCFAFRRIQPYTTRRSRAGSQAPHNPQTAPQPSTKQPPTTHGTSVIQKNTIQQNTNQKTTIPQNAIQQHNSRRNARLNTRRTQPGSGAQLDEQPHAKNGSHIESNPNIRRRDEARMEEDLHAGADSRAKDGTDTHRDHGTQSGKHSAPGPRMPGRMPKVWGYGLVLGLVGLLVMIGGCSSESHKATRSANTKAASPTTARPASPSGAPPQATNSEPARVDIQAINAHSTLVPLGLDKDGSLATPPLSQVGQAGWYAGGPAPGEKGPAVIVGHVDSRQYGPGVFQNLSKLKPGDPVEVKRKDGSIIVFDVESVKEFPKNNFPTQQVYGNLDYPGLRLITCGGNFDASSGHYVDNIVAFAKQASVRK